MGPAGMIPIPALGVRFDIGRLGGGAYGLEAWKVFWRAVPRRAIAGALLYEGDTSATLSGAENVFMIAVHHPDIAALQRLAAALNSSSDYQSVAATPDLAWNESMAAEPLPEAGRIDGRGALVGGLWARSALEAIKAGGPARPSVEAPTAPASGACPNCGAPAQPTDVFCGVCGASLASASAEVIKEPAAAVAPAPNNCPNCGTPVQPSDVFCMVCGTTLTSAAASTEVREATPAPAPAPADTCPNCGSAVLPGDAFCIECGTTLAAPAAPTVLPSPALSFGELPVWAWIAIGLVILLIMAGGVFVLVSGDDDDPTAPGVGPAARPGSRPLAGGYTAEDAANTFQVILVVLREGSGVVDRVMLDCRPDGVSQIPFTVASDVPAGGSSFTAGSNTVEIEGSFTSETRAEGTIRILDFEFMGECGFSDGDEWTSVCSHRAVLTEEGGFELTKATSGACAAEGTPIPPDPVRPPGGPPIGQIDSAIGELIVEGYRVVGEYPPGCEASSDQNQFCQGGGEEGLGIVTIRLRQGPFNNDLFGGLFEEAADSFLESSDGDRFPFSGFWPSQDMVRIDIMYGSFEPGAGPHLLVWPGNAELPL
jgi:hypothetical protein